MAWPSPTKPNPEPAYQQSVDLTAYQIVASLLWEMHDAGVTEIKLADEVDFFTYLLPPATNDAATERRTAEMTERIHQQRHAIRWILLAITPVHSAPGGVE